MIDYFERHVIGARGEKTTLRVPFDGVDFVLVALECPYGHVLAQSAHVDLHVCTARGECRVRLPVDVQRWCCVECELLLACACLRVPDYRRLLEFTFLLTHIYNIYLFFRSKSTKIRIFYNKF